MLRAIACVLLPCLLAACGRLHFDRTADLVDASITNDPTPDTNAEIPDLVARYPMDVLIRDDVVPASPISYSGACADGACPTLIPGKIGRAYAFDAAQWILLPPAVANRVGAGPFTITVWAAPAVTAGDSVLFAKPYAVTADTDVVSLLVLAGTQDVAFETTPDGAEFAYLHRPAGTDLEIGDWHHVAISWDGANKRIYLDGTLAGSIATTIAMSDLPLMIGADLDSGAVTHHYLGALDDLRLYARALRDDEIAALARAP